MKKLRFCLVLLAVFAIMGGTAFAYNAADHVKIAPNGEGDLIFFPWYLAASGGWQTQITVINTSNSYSTVAKVVIRSHNWSDELLDFLIYLSPNDVWTGYIRYGVQGTYIYSDDDSILVNRPSAPMNATTDAATYFASPTNPVSQPFYNVKCSAASKIDSKTDSTDYGYIEVIEASATTALGSGKKGKDLVYNWYEYNMINGTIVNNGVRVMTPVNILTGYHEFENTTAGSYSALMRAQVFSDWKNISILDSFATTGIENTGNNSIGELEAAMAKTDIALPYIWKGAAATLHFFTFPTKLSFGYKDATNSTPCDTYGTLLTGSNLFLGKLYSDFWGADSRYPRAKCLPYTSLGYDLKENTVTTGPFSGGSSTQKICEEMQWIPAYIPGELFTEGWIRYTMGADTTFRTATPLGTDPQTYMTGLFHGAPVLASSLYIRAASVSEADAAWTQKSVTINSIPAYVYDYYQYADYHNF